MNDYPKINTLYMRDENKLIIQSQYTKEEFHFLKYNLWECTEKIDGTNIHIDYIGGEVRYCGRTENALIPTQLLLKLQELFTKEKLSDAFEGDVCIYGEGYGRKIQGCSGNYISNGVDFILFDVMINGYWLSRENCECIAEKLGLKIVPLVGYMTIPEAESKVESGFKSLISEDKNLFAEGLVLKTQCGLKARNGERIITKIKHVDFEKLKQQK